MATLNPGVTNQAKTAGAATSEASAKMLKEALNNGGAGILQKKCPPPPAPRWGLLQRRNQLIRCMFFQPHLSLLL